MAVSPATDTATDVNDAVATRVVAAHADPLPFETAPAASVPTAPPRCEPPALSTPGAGTQPADLDRLLDARSPLLARAFAAAGSDRPTTEP